MIRLLCLFRAVGIAWGTTGQDVAYRSTPQGESKMAVSDPDGWKPTAAGLCAMSILNQSAKPASMVRFNPGGLAQAEPLARIPPTILFFGSADQLYLASALAKN